ncbi:MAG: hypothetical protein L0Z50_37080 [Verrucomicrobiales bacterium]|nr:hypothetical protein [Verrucomicrobiales bacterium]
MRFEAAETFHAFLAWKKSHGPTAEKFTRADFAALLGISPRSVSALLACHASFRIFGQILRHTATCPLEIRQRLRLDYFGKVLGFTGEVPIEHEACSAICSPLRNLPELTEKMEHSVKTLQPFLTRSHPTHDLYEI